MVGNDMFYDEMNNVYITSFENWKSVIFAIRTLAISFASKFDAQDRLEDIKDKVYEFVKGPDFANYFSRIRKINDGIEKVFKTISKQAADGIGEVSKLTNELAMLDSQIKSLL